MQEQVAGDVVVLGGGLAGLAAGCELTRAGRSAVVLEAGPVLGGLSRTIEHGDFRFDLGGHRFFADEKEVEEFVLRLMGDEMRTVSRKSTIFMRGRFFDYPLRPANAFFGMGPGTSVRIIADYLLEKVRALSPRPPAVSLEDWVVRNFGRTIFNLYFKEYSEKVWGIGCDRIAAEWVSRRIRGLSLGVAIRNAFFRFSGRDLPTLADLFVYPERGIGRISDRMGDEIGTRNRLFTSARVEEINHRDSTIEHLRVRNGAKSFAVGGSEFISTIPVVSLVEMLRPRPPAAVREAAARLRYRDLVVVAVMLDRVRVTGETWVYIPEKRIPFGRIHEPTNWSPRMAPPGKTLLVTEYFCFEGDDVWLTADEGLVATTVAHLERLGFIRAKEVIDARVVRVPRAYPLFEVGYREHFETVSAYLARFGNLHSVGRSGLFCYYNMDHTMASGMRTAARVSRKVAAAAAGPPA